MFGMVRIWRAAQESSSPSKRNSVEAYSISGRRLSGMDSCLAVANAGRRDEFGPARPGVASGLEKLYQHRSECLSSNLMSLTFHGARPEERREGKEKPCEGAT